MRVSAPFLTHCSFLVVALVLTYVWTKSPALSYYTLQTIALLVVLYFLNRLFEKFNRYSLALDGLIFTMVTLLLVTQTGNLTSPLFFLLYILLFGLALFFEPLSTLVFSLALMAFFFPQANDSNGMIQILSLSLMTPLALYFGKQYLQILQEEERIRVLEKKESYLSAEVEKQEQETLVWLSLSFREQVNKIVNLTSDLLADVSRTTPTQREKLRIIHESGKQLLRLGRKLREQIEG